MFGTYNRLRVPVWSSDIAVIRAARLKIHRKHRRSLAMRKARHEFYQVMLRYHHDAQKLCAQFRL